MLVAAGAPWGTFFLIVTGIKRPPQESTQHRSMILKNCFYWLAWEETFYFLFFGEKKKWGGVEELPRKCHVAKQRVINSWWVADRTLTKSSTWRTTFSFKTLVSRLKLKYDNLAKLKYGSHIIKQTVLVILLYEYEYAYAYEDISLIIIIIMCKQPLLMIIYLPVSSFLSLLDLHVLLPQQTHLIPRLH